ncbi:MAG: hypothetical protein AB9866_11700 [Syntrophobacteraceae bacterium]
MQIMSPIRFMGVVALLFALCGTAGCLASRIKGTTNQPVDTGMEIFVHSAIESHVMQVICIFPFISAPETANASPAITAAFQSRLVQRRPFREVKPLPFEVKTDAEALWYARNEGCGLAMVPSIVYLMDGTGAMPTKLVVRIRILDARTGMVLWDVKQNALSEPGFDVDLTWNTFAGEPAQRCHVLADHLAGRFADFLVQPLIEKEKKKSAGELSPGIVAQ